MGSFRSPKPLEGNRQTAFMVRKWKRGTETT